MSDFLINLNNTDGSAQLLTLLRQLPRYTSPVGESFEFPWGSLAVLPERFGKNIFRVNGAVVAWVGDVVTDLSEAFLQSLVSSTLALRARHSANANSSRIDLAADPALSRLNGTFAFLVADQQGVSVITDPMNFVAVYSATDDRGQIVAIGTHPDLVASLGRQTAALDLVSIGEFLNAGTPLFPNTVYQNVKELSPGSVYALSPSADGVAVARGTYWLPPQEIREGYNEAALCEELRETLLSIVRSRCVGDKVGVFLSGGLDSRLIMAAVPSGINCLGITFANHRNRETRTAQKVAQCYNREWVLLLRDPDYLSECLRDAVRLTGCEYEWTCAQVMGVSRHLPPLNVDVVLEGTLFNDYFKAYTAREWTMEKRWAGLKPARLRKSDWSYLDQIAPLWQQSLAPAVLSRMRARRQHTFDSFVDPSRGSVAEWMEVYPFSQDPTVGYWPAERRTLPVRLVAMDRRALDFSFRCPIELKLGSRLFKKAACQIYGPGNRIPDANDGVRPGSGHWSRLAQRGFHEVKRRGIKLSQQLTGGVEVPHSWHDYPRYWRENPRLRQFCHEYGPNLDEFDGTLIEGRGQDLMARPGLHWEYGFRLLQLAVWRDIVRGYASLMPPAVSLPTTVAC